MTMTGTEKRMAEALATIREGGESLDAIAARLGTYKQNLSAFTHGRRGAQIAWLERVCSVYGFSPVWLLTGKGRIKEEQ